MTTPQPPTDRWNRGGPTEIRDRGDRISSLPTVVGLKDTGGASVTINTLRDMGTSVNDIDPAAISRTLRSALQSLDLDETSGDPQ